MVNEHWQFVINQYLKDLNSLFYISSDRRDCIVTPFTRPDGEAIEILAEYTGDGFLMLSDNCTTFDYLFVNGLSAKNYSFSRYAKRGHQRSFEQINGSVA